MIEKLTDKLPQAVLDELPLVMEIPSIDLKAYEYNQSP